MKREISAERTRRRIFGRESEQSGIRRPLQEPARCRHYKQGLPPDLNERFLE